MYIILQLFKLSLLPLTIGRPAVTRRKICVNKKYLKKNKKNINRNINLSPSQLDCTLPITCSLSPVPYWILLLVTCLVLTTRGGVPGHHGNASTGERPLGPGGWGVCDCRTAGYRPAHAEPLLPGYGVVMSLTCYCFLCKPSTLVS